MGFSKIGASAKGGGKDFDPAPAGVSFAICTQVVHLGKQRENFKGKDKVLDKVYIRFELPDHRIEYEKDGKTIKAPVVIGQTFTLSIGEKSNLGPFLEGWRGKPFTEEEKVEFNIASIIGKSCQLNIVHDTGADGKVRAKIKGAFPLIQEQKDRIKADPKRAKSEGELIVYTPTDHSDEVYNKLPNWIHEKLAAAVKDKPAADDFNQDVPRDQITGEPQDFNDDLESIPF